jgi:hypothetical protein
MAYGMPVVMGPNERPPAGTGDPYGGRDVTVFEIIKDSAIDQDFEEFLRQFPDSWDALYEQFGLGFGRLRDFGEIS